MTQRTLAEYIVQQRKAHYHFTAKNNQKKLLKEVASFFENVYWHPDHTTKDKPDHGREENRKIWVTTELNDVDFPHVGQAFKVGRIIKNRKSGKTTHVIAYGITSKTPDLATAEQVLRDNRQHWSIENMTRLRRFAVGLIKSKGVSNVAQKMRQLSFSPRMVFDYLRISANTHTFSAVEG